MLVITSWSDPLTRKMWNAHYGTSQRPQTTIKELSNTSNHHH